MALLRAMVNNTHEIIAAIVRQTAEQLAVNEQEETAGTDKPQKASAAKPGFAVHRYMNVLLSFISNAYEKLLKGTSWNACIYVDCIKARQ